MLSKPLQSLGLQLWRSCMLYIWEAVLWQSIGPQQYSIDVMLIQLRNGHLRSSINHIFCIRSSIDLRIHQKILCHNTNRFGMPSNIILLLSLEWSMVQKLSKCEVKAWLWWSLIILPSLRFYVKSNFGEFKQSKNVILGNLRDSELWIFGKFGTWKLLKFTKIKIQNF